MLGERGKGGGGIFDQYSGVFDVGGGPLIESDIGGQKALLRREQRKEHLRLTRRRTNWALYGFEFALRS